MRILRRNSGARAFTRLELFVVVATVVLLISCLLPWLARHKAGHSRLGCVSNLKQVGLAFRIFANENDDRYPFAVSNLTNEHTGTLLASNTAAQAWMHFQALSNELQSAWVLMCPKDTNRWATMADDFLDSTPKSLSHPAKRDLAVSYFVGLYADETKAQAILAGDRNLSAIPHGRAYSSHTAGGAIPVRANAAWTDAWPAQLHGTNGNIALADGSVQQMDDMRVRDSLISVEWAYGTNINLFLFPQ